MQQNMDGLAKEGRKTGSRAIPFHRHKTVVSSEQNERKTILKTEQICLEWVKEIAVWPEGEH